MKIDKATGDALSNWVCPPCSRSPVKAASNEVAAAREADEKLPAQQENENPQSAPPLQPQQDISPHAPNPVSLWPPLGLRGCKEAVEVLGKAGESDNEDFAGPLQPPIARVKSDAAAAAPSASQIEEEDISALLLCQPVANLAHMMAASLTAPSDSTAPSVSNAPVSQTQGGISQASQKTEVAQMNPAPASSEMAHQASISNNHESKPKPILNGLSVAVANMDQIVLAAGDNGAGLQHDDVKTAPIAMEVDAPNAAPTEMEVDEPNTAPVESSNVQDATGVPEASSSKMP